MIAAPSAWHERHEEAAGALREVAALPAHVLLEVYAVLTRLPAGLAVPATTAAGALADRFPDAVLTLADLAPLPAAFARADVFGGASHDGLVALEAAAHGRELVTLDERAQATYQRLGVGFRAL